MRRLISMIAIVLALFELTTPLSAAATGESTADLRQGTVRVLHFPPDHYVGGLYWAGDSEILVEPDAVCLSNGGPYLGEARGDVTVPADRGVQLVVCPLLDPQDMARLRRRDPRTYEFVKMTQLRTGPYDLSCLSDLEPNDLHKLIVACPGARVDSDRRFLEPIAHLTGMRILSLQSTGVTDKGLEHLRAMRHLKAIEFSSETLVKSDGLAVLKDLPALEFVDLDTGATDIGLKHIAQVPNLRWLRIRTGRIWGPGLAELARASRLERLCLWGESRFTDRQVAYLEGLTQLKSLTIWGIGDQLTDASLASIAKLKNLEELHFIMTTPRFTAAGLAHLQGLEKLRTAAFGHVWVGSEGMAHGDEIAWQLAAMPQLEVVEGVCYLSAEGVAMLGRLPRLRCLHLGLRDHLQDYDGPTGLSHLAGLTCLQELRIETGDVLSAADLAGLDELSHLKVLDIHFAEITDDGVALLGRMNQLEELSLDPVILSRLNHLNGLSNLRRLSAKHTRSWDTDVPPDEGTLDLSGLKNLRGLGLSGMALHDEDLAFLDTLPLLEGIAISPTSPLPGVSLRRFAKLHHLNHLSIHGLSRCTGQNLASLNGLTELRGLIMTGDVPDDALTSLDELPSLVSLSVHTPEPIQQQTLADLRQRLDGLGYLHVTDALPGQEATAVPRSDDSKDNATIRRQQGRRDRRIRR